MNLTKTLKWVVISIVLLIAVFLFGKFNKYQWIHKDEKVVKAALYDSLIAIAEKPPTVVTDTIRDTIYVYIPEVDTIYAPSDTIYGPEEDEESVTVLDILKSKYFTIFMDDEIFAASLDHILRKWSYEVYKEEYVTTVEVEKPVIVEKPCEYTLQGLYGGAGYHYGFDGLHEVVVDLSYLHKSGKMFSLEGGIVYNHSNKGLYPMVGLSMKGKFK